MSLFQSTEPKNVAAPGRKEKNTTETRDHETSPQEIAQYITTEHYTLQTARSTVLAEINGRTNLFIGAMSSAVVALAFIGQVSRLGDAFFTFALVLFPPLVFLGLVTFQRIIQASLVDNRFARAILHNHETFSGVTR